MKDESAGACPPLPHRSPFLLLDAIVELVPTEHARAAKLLSSSDPLLRDDSSLNELLLLEAMAQCAGIASAAEGDPQGVLVAVDEFRVFGAAVAGDRLMIEARVVKKMGPMVKARVTVHVDGDLRAQGQVVLRLGALPTRPVWKR